MTSISQELRPATAGDGLLAADLLADAGRLVDWLGEMLGAGHWLDAYLLAAGLSQLTEDRLHPDPLMLNRAASYLRGRPSSLAGAAGTASAAGGALLRAGAAPASGRLRQARDELVALTGWLAGRVLAPGRPGGPVPLLRTLPAALPALDGEILRLPACFHSFDQHPDDVRWLVRALRQRYPLTGRPVCVLGVRTSGSYLAPLVAAQLRATGGPPVTTLTYRPARPFLRWERSRLRALADAGAMVLVTDDPPGSGTSLADAARAVHAAGVPDSSIVLLLSLFGSAAELPSVLRRWAAVVQPWPDWSVHCRLAAQPVRKMLSGLVGPDTEVTELRPAGPPAPSGDRGHVRARFAVLFTDRRTGARDRREVVAEGAGLGYLGRSSIAVARTLPGYLPHVYGFADGLLLRDWLPAGPEPGSGPALAGAIARYVTARRQALPAPAATVQRMGGRDPVWEVAAKLASGQFGPLAVPARPLLLDPLMRRLLRPRWPAVADGKTDRRHWLPDPAAGGELRKVDFYQRSFGHLDLACYDPVFDLAGAAADPPDGEFERQLLEAYHRASGEQADPERWLLYRLAQLWRLQCARDVTPDRARQRSAAAVHDYLAAKYLAGLPAAGGPLCAIDLDGVLECDRLGYPASSPTGARALRALIAHGYRPVLATGRSLPEVRDRCQAFGLVGGVAEYGTAVLYQGEATDLRPPAIRAMLDEIRATLTTRPGLEVDPGYRYAVRVRAGHGPVPADFLSGVRGLAGPEVRVIHGESQTDITAADLDKATGMQALRHMLGDPPLALAVGDTPPDVPLLAQAALARAPRNARLPAAAQITRTRGAYQAGLLDACGALLGHRPGRCAVCRAREFTPRERATLALLDLRANGLAALPGGTAALGALLIRRRQW